jgi:ElaB/YqjD/DUF883 family membrane-anchored ribosome-binding protein
MKYGVTRYLPAPMHTDGASKSLVPESLRLARRNNADQNRNIESYVSERPLLTIGAAFCTGVILAWMIKRR